MMVTPLFSATISSCKSHWDEVNVTCGVTNGTTDSTFSPSNGCTRAQIVTFLYRTMK